MIQAVAVYSCGTPEHALGNLRVCAPLQRAGVQVRWHPSTEPFAPTQVAESDVVIVQRDFPRHASQYAQVVRAACVHHKPIVFEIDDLLWELPADHPDQISGFYNEALWPMLLAAVQADAISIASPEMGKYLQGMNSHIWLLPNYFDDSVWHLRPPQIRADPIVKIGYMGGDSHLPDVQSIEPALVEVLRRYPSARLIFWGVQPPNRLSDHPQVSWNPLGIPNYAQFAAYFLQQELDIFVAPLQNNRFNACKSPVKFFECSALGAAGVCSDIAPYRWVVEAGQSGFLAETTEQWVEALSRLIEQPELRLRLASRAQDCIRRNWLLSAHAGQWVEAYQQMTASYQPRETAAAFELAASLQAQQAQRLQQMEAAWQARLAQSEQRSAALEAKLDEIERSRAWKWVQRYWRWAARWRGRRRSAAP